MPSLILFQRVLKLWLLTQGAGRKLNKYLTFYGNIKYISPNLTVSVTPCTDSEVPDKQLVWLGHLVWMPWQQHPTNLAPPLPHGHMVVDQLFSSWNKNHTHTHINTLHFKREGVILQIEQFSSATHCFLTHWPHGSSLVIELVCRRKLQLTPLLHCLQHSL